MTMPLYMAVLAVLRRDSTKCAARHLCGYTAHSRISLTGGLWFWRVFVGAFALSKAMEVVLAAEATAKNPGDRARIQVQIDELQDLQFTYDNLIRRWSKASRVRDWPAVRKVLMGVVWPEFSSSEDIARSIWERAARGY